VFGGALSWALFPFSSLHNKIKTHPMKVNLTTISNIERGLLNKRKPLWENNDIETSLQLRNVIVRV
jgi:hypothetical protein